MADGGRPRTVAELRDQIAARLAGVFDDPLGEARELLAALHDAPRSWTTTHAGDETIDLLIDASSDAVVRRLAGAPLAYATSRAAFRHLFLHVDERVLIPRPETEELVTLALPLIAAGSTVVDVGTGSGAIALALAQESQAARVIGTDLSPGAIDVAEMNARALLRRQYARTQFLAGNLLEPLGDTMVDVIVSNPPYIALHERDALPASVRDHEPALALFGGDDGMAVIRALVAQASARLVPGGALLLEVDARRPGEALGCLAPPDWEGARVVPDAFGRDRFVVARRSAATHGAPAGSDHASTRATGTGSE
ncbi:MAG: peptide chain release factor N(5)-glutamine methyltransferase [Gemmatimonadaceae bacterium]|nr:peptide chain release factor N(5)-glutamine methyltransferase [Gemmatimonadaceae bacterium]